jgi:hypothetical protein
MQAVLQLLQANVQRGRVKSSCADVNQMQTQRVAAAMQQVHLPGAERARGVDVQRQWHGGGFHGSSCLQYLYKNKQMYKYCKQECLPDVA